MDVAVLGGTFAPPTLAHLALLRAGMAFTGARMGVWVPSSASYMRKWRLESMPDAWFIDAGNRAGMLLALCAAEGDMALYPDEMAAAGDTYTFDTLCALEKKYGGRVAFIMGSDLVPSLPGWYRAEELTRRFRIVAASRGDDALMGAAGVEVMPFSAAYRDVSATAVRALILAGKADEARGYLHPAVYDYILNHREVPADA
jgi:nicotinate (nicotinamide) nucleotide adenylyltransferase